MAVSFLHSNTYTTDEDLRRFVYVAGLSDQNHVKAASSLIKNLKASGIWDKFSAVYPMIGGTSTAHGVNMRYPQSSGIVFNQLVTHDGSGMHLAEGGYGNTTVTVPNTENSHISYYVLNATTTANDVIFGSYINGVEYYLQSHNSGANSVFSPRSSSYAVAGAVSRGLELGSSGTYSADLYLQGAQIASTGSGPFVAGTLYLGALNNNGNATNYTTSSCGFASVGSYLTPPQVAALSTAVEELQDALAR